MKKLFIRDAYKLPSGTKIEIYGWIQNIRDQKDYIFVDIVDSTGKIQSVIKKQKTNKNTYRIHKESSVCAVGVLRIAPNGKHELINTSIKIIGDVDLQLSPLPRSSFDIFKYERLCLNKRHLYLRNPIYTSILRIRDRFMQGLRNYFYQNNLVEINAPILTQIPLYPGPTAFNVDFFGTEVFLTQCTAFYLESAIFAFEKVFNIGPSFRKEHSKGKRHLAEYWHTKVELAWANIDDIMKFAEEMIYYVAEDIENNSKKELNILGISINKELLKPPYKRITYNDALNILKAKGKPLQWGKSLGADEEKILSEDYDSPFWVLGIPKNLEPFPYKIDEKDHHIVKVADLLAPKGYGEILGTAEKIWKVDQLINRMKEKGISPYTEKYKWYIELRKYGSVPHSGFGMGIERTLRWLLKLPHVRDAIAFPRMFKNKPYP